MYFYKICQSSTCVDDYIILPKIVFDHMAERCPLLRVIAMNNWNIQVIDNNNLVVPIEHTCSFTKDSDMYLKFNSFLNEVVCLWIK